MKTILNVLEEDKAGLDALFNVLVERGQYTLEEYDEYVGDLIILGQSAMAKIMLSLLNQDDMLNLQTRLVSYTGEINSN
jgi:hypothetical protein